MAQKKDCDGSRDVRKKVRHKSDDVTSLDSWSEITNENVGFQSERKSELFLNPATLSTIDEPDEPKKVSVKLNKSSISTVGGDGIRIKPFALFRSFGAKLDEVGTESGMLRSEAKPNGGKREVTRFHQPQTFFNKHESCDKVQGPCGNAVCENNSLMDECAYKHCLENKKSESHKHQHSFVKQSQNFLKPKHRPLNSHRLKKSTPNGLNVENDDDQIDQGEKVKNKIISVWNNVKYGWTLKTKATFQDDSPIFLLGKCYHKKPGDYEPEPGQMMISGPVPSQCMVQFHQDFQSRLWFTYRRDFQALANTKYTTDCGWGCMLRSSQMMLAQAFVCHFLGRDWRAHCQTKEQETFYRTIIQWFGDSSSDQCPFSVHKLAEFGRLFGKRPGEWYGPSSVAYILRDAVNKANQSQPVLKDICVYVAQDCTVYKEDVRRLCTTRPRNLTGSNDTEAKLGAIGDVADASWTRSVIVLIPVRLGGEDFNPIYEQCIKNIISQDSCIGLIGGKPKHSLYFVGWQDSKLIYLDPHFCQDSVDTLRRDFKVESYHCFSPRKISLSRIDPSATVGFYCRGEEDFQQFVDQTEMIVAPSRGSVYPMFVFNEGSCEDVMKKNLDLSLERSLRIQHIDEKGRYRSLTDSEEYVVL